MSFVTGTAGRGQCLAVLAQVEAEDGELLDDWRVGFWVDGDWRSELEFDFKPVALAPFGDQPDAWAILGVRGQVLWIEDATTRQTIHEDHVAVGLQPAFTTIRPFGTGLAAAQMSRSVYRSNGRGWQLLGSGMRSEQPGEFAGLEALAEIDGELYGCGWRGEIWYIQDGIWRQPDSPTNTILTGAAVHPAGEVIICGRLGTILRGRHDRWAIVDHQQTDEDFWSVAVFQGRIYLSSMRAIYELVDRRLIPVDDGSTTVSYYHLSANDQIMVSIGARSVLVTDGKEWQQII